MNWKRFFALLLVLALLPALFGNAFAAGPKARTAQYYAKRPCAGLCESAAALFDAYVQENPPENA